MTLTRTTSRGRSGMKGRAAARMAEPSIADSPFERKPITDVWKMYKRKGARDVRNYLMQKYLHLVRYNAERIYARLPDEVDIEDLMSAGVFGLMDAIDAYDLERQVKFETYCAPRIRGAILDELRHMDWVPRLVRHRQARVDEARRQIEQKLGRPATSDEISQFLGVGRDEFEKIERDSKAVTTISITRKLTQGDGSQEMREIDVARDEDADNPLRQIQRKDLQDLVTKGLSRAERLIVVLYYYEGMTMKEIGATLDLSESRVSQMHSSILQRLKAQMQHRARELEPAR